MAAAPVASLEHRWPRRGLHCSSDEAPLQPRRSSNDPDEAPLQPRRSSNDPDDAPLQPRARFIGAPATTADVATQHATVVAEAPGRRTGSATRAPRRRRRRHLPPVRERPAQPAHAPRRLAPGRPVGALKRAVWPPGRRSASRRP
uniref:Uncharacterized protein n=1 Tax=Aegilops tauschii subsp. strangulata TaxID=200361 RepID=A0A453DEV0_AEGTS